MGKTHCNNCKGNRNHKELFEKKIRGGEDDGFVWIEKFKVIECLGCNNISFLKVYGDISMVDYDHHGNPIHYDEETVYPYYLEKGEEIKYQHHLPSTIKIIYQETISAFKADSYILTAGGLRAIIEAICNHLKIKNDNLEKRIDSLHKKGHLTLSESKRLHSIRFLGNDALHEMAKPKKEHLYLLLEIVNHLLANLFINDKIIKGKVATIIDKYEEFVNLIENLISDELIKKEMTLSNLLGKSKRLIEKSKYSDFEKEFEKDVKNKKIDFLKINNNSKENETAYIITKVPEQSLPW
ncbi:protein of unknown function [Maribacter dokdonensis]|uniref:DUF4145 domain-containing protein n=1 Tax=Maribacter dokdonensis TaxID=320912 RepID=A0A1H4LF68_9FLAO|nr:DUF4145 domain-containing protein [Maribacter dokdonensis]SEB69389.1 protein of unknown function [Maribacter dokdonensis]